MAKGLDELAREYAPYDRMPEFWQGFDDYNCGSDIHMRHDGVQGQAYDRGRECAMRYRKEQ